MYSIQSISLFLLTIFTSFCFAVEDIDLTKQELQFIKNNPVITIGSSETFEPYIFKNNAGIASGYDKDIADIIEQKTGLKINFEFGPWNEIQNKAAKGELDGLSTVVITEEREALYHFTNPYLQYTAIAIVNRSNHQGIYTKEDVQNKRAAVQSGNAGFEQMTKALGDIEIVYYDDIYAVLNAVVNNEVDFAVLDESVYYVANKLGISEFISTSFVVNNEGAVHFAFTKRKPLLTSIVNKALDSIGEFELAEIKSNWFDTHTEEKIKLTAEEKEYLYQKKAIKYCIIPDFYPIESNQDGNHVGISADFLDAFQHHLPISFQFVETESLGESLLAVKNGKCDFLSMVMKTPKRTEYLYFTKPYFSTPLVIATKYNVPFIQSLENLANKKLGIIKDNAYIEIIKQRYPAIIVVEVNDIKEGLSRVKSGELFGYIGALATISQQFKKGYSSKLKITGQFDEKWDLSIATSKNDTILQGVFDKLITTISDDEKQEALNKYLSINYEAYVDHSTTYKIAGLSLIILIIVLLWNYRLQISKKLLNKQYDRLSYIKNKIQESESHLKVVLNHGHIGNWKFNVHDHIAQCSSQHDKIFGYDSPIQNWTYERFLEHVIDEDKGYIDKLFQDAIKNKTDLSYECRIKRKDGEIRWIFGSGGQEVDNDGQIHSMSGIVQDITERKRIEMAKSIHHAELQSLFNALPDIYFRMSHDGTILDYHAQNEKQLYLKPEDFLGKQMQSLLPKEIGDKFILKLNEVSLIDEPLIFNYELLIKDELAHFEARINRIAINNQIICVIRDVTEECKSTEFLAASEQRFRMIFEQAAIGVALIDVNTGGFIRVNQQLASMLGYSIEEMSNGKTFKDITHPNDLKVSLNHVKKVISGKRHAANLEKRYLHKDGNIVWAELTISTSEKPTTQSSQILIAIVKDISKRKEAEEKIRLAANVFTYAAEGIVITDKDNAIIDVNDTFIATTGYSREEVVGKSPSMLASGRHSSDFYEAMWQSLLEKGNWSGEVWNRRKNNEVYVEMLNISSVKDTNGEITNYVGLFTDISLMKKHQNQLEHSARYDMLTNLPNRSLLADRLSQAMLQCRRHNQSVAVAFLDLDGFKAVNDTHGHGVGDELLIALSNSMGKALREGDTLARIGGDEFVVVLADLDKAEDCEPILKRLLKATSTPITVGEVTLNISSSIGLTLYPQDNVSADQLMRHADQAMYIAKESGKNRYHLFNTAQDDAIKAHRESLNEVRYALENQQFVLYYQPKVNMKTGVVTGVEALIRWNHPKRGLLNPIDFLPIIENDPISIELGEWVIDTSLTQISQWHKNGLELPVSTSVNIAATQLQQPNFTEKLVSLLQAHPDVAPQYLELEILETSALEDVHHVSEVMRACMDLGVRFALDDFGTGYSSLTYLRRLPANLIKIDQSFVRDMLVDADDLAIVEGVIALAKSFKRDVIAEGVESVDHGTALLQLGCELAQGYGIAKPMPANEIPAWVNNWVPDASWKIE